MPLRFTPHVSRFTSRSYDPAGNLSQFTDRKSQQSTFTYDNLNRRTGASYADGSSTSFVYDSVGRLAKATDSIAGAIEFGYDQLDRLMQETTPQGTVTYQYDALGRRTQMTANGQSSVTYGYDAASRLTQVAQAGLVVGLGYDNANRRTSLTYPNGTNASYTYDNASRLTGIAHNGPSGLIESLSYVYDAAGNRISLTRANGTASNLPAAVQAAYDAANEQVTFNSLPSTFDANGNLTTSTDAAGTTTYTWDVRNRLIARSGPGINEQFSYDALGRRVSKSINGQITQFLYDGREITMEIGGGAVVASYLSSLDVDERFVRQSSTDEFYHADVLGSTLALTNVGGSATTTYGYEAFGKTTSTGVSSNSFQYAGRENDNGGEYYNRARYYSPTRDRFISEDPVLAPYTPLSIGLCRMTNRTVWRLPRMIRASSADTAQLLNSYVYAKNTPLRFAEPLGLAPDGPKTNPCKAQQQGCLDSFDPYDLANKPGAQGCQAAWGIGWDDFIQRQCNGNYTPDCMVGASLNASLECGRVGYSPPKACSRTFFLCAYYRR